MCMLWIVLFVKADREVSPCWPLSAGMESRPVATMYWQAYGPLSWRLWVAKKSSISTQTFEMCGLIIADVCRPPNTRKQTWRVYQLVSMASGEQMRKPRHVQWPANYTQPLSSDSMCNSEATVQHDYVRGQADVSDNKENIFEYFSAFICGSSDMISSFLSGR